MNKIKINNLQELIVSKLVPLIESDYVLLDVPNYGNIGDHLIYEGELFFLKNYIKNNKSIHTSNCYNFNDSKVKSNTTILLQGGGNFGDIYDLHQNFRKEIIQKYPQNRIIILPQTVYYKNSNKLKIDCELFKKHKNLYICVRDNLSYELLAHYIDSSKLLLLPDMAFFVDFSDSSNSEKTKKALIMDRIDVEATGELDKSLINKLEKDNFIVDIEDWPTYYKTLDIKGYDLLNRVRVKSLNIVSKLPLFDRYITSNTNDILLKDHYIKMGLKFMAKYDVVYTTRLHGLILAILLGKEVVALDNSYGKLSSFYNTWLTDFENVTLQSNKYSIC